jgi:hypothetical protein
VISSANLSLYAHLTATSGNFGNPTFGPANASYLKRVTAAWDENAVNWNTKPGFDTTDQVLLPQSTGTTQDYPNIDISAFVQYWAQNPGQNFGMLLDIITSNSLNSLIFYSSDYIEADKRPKLDVCYSIPTSISEINSTFELQVYPNPATKDLNIPLYGLQAQHITIYNVNGKLVSETNQPVNNRIDISELPGGIYIAEVKANEMVKRVRWVKM